MEDRAADRLRAAGRVQADPDVRLADALRPAVLRAKRLLGRYWRHPDANQEKLFFGLLRECVDEGIVTEAMLREEMRLNHVRHDAFEVLERTQPLAA